MMKPVLFLWCVLTLGLGCAEDQTCSGSDDNLILECRESDDGDGYDCTCSIDATTISTFSDPDICDTGIAVADVAALCL